MGEGFPLWSLAPMAWKGREPLRYWIYLSIFAFSDFAPSPFLLYLAIRNSDWGESFAQIFLIKLAFLRQKKSVNRLTGGPRESRARPGGRAPPLSRGHHGHRFTLILPPENHKYSKIIVRPFLSRLDSVWYWVSAKHKTWNKQELALALDQYVSPKNSIKSCQKYMKVEEYWHETIKKYR